MRPAEKTTGARSLLAIAGLGLSAALVAGCSSSSSPSQTASTSSTSPGATSSTGASGSPGAGGTGSPSATPTGPTPPPLTFHGVSHGAWLWVKNIEPRLSGVANATYDGGSHTLRVFFEPGATSLDVRNVKSIVKQAERLAAKGQEPGTSPSRLHQTKKSPPKPRHRRHHQASAPTPSPTPTPFPTPHRTLHPGGPTSSPTLSSSPTPKQ